MNHIFYAINIHNVNLDFPDFGSNFGSDILSSLTLMLSELYSLFITIVTAVENFYIALKEVNNYIRTMCDSIGSGSVGGVPLLEAIGAYRYLVTDPIFYLTYISVLTGCLFTIYKLIVLLVKSFRVWKQNLSTGSGLSSSGVLVSITKYLKG